MCDVLGRGRGCTGSCALLTYCWFGTSGLGLQTVPLFVSTASQNVCFPQKGIKVPFLRLARATATGAVRRAQVCKPRPAPALTVAACSPCSRGPRAMAGWPPVAFWAGSQLPFLKLQSLQWLGARSFLQELACPPWKWARVMQKAWGNFEKS